MLSIGRKEGEILVVRHNKSGDLLLIKPHEIRPATPDRPGSRDRVKLAFEDKDRNFEIDTLERYLKATSVPPTP